VVFRIRKSTDRQYTDLKSTDRQYTDLKTKDKRNNNDLQNTKDRVT